MAREKEFLHEEEEEEDFEIAMQKLEIPYQEIEPFGLISNLADEYLREILEDSSLQLEDEDDPNHNKSIDSSNGSLNSPSTATKGKSCSHCGTRKTPMWREGPKGKKTLCNACGVRYKTGRLFPEYRPASSPDFKPNVHSNFHRKIMEIRKEKNSGTNSAGFEGF